MRMPSRNVVLLVLALAAALAFGAWEVRQRARYLTEEDARIRADMVTVSSRVPGWVTRRAVREGQAVDKGDVLLTIDARDAELALTELAAQRAAALAERARLAAETRLARTRTEVRAAERAMLAARVAEFDARIRRQQLDLEDRTLRSPVRGVVDRTFVEPGEYVGAGQRLLLVHDPSVIWIEANVRETQLRRLAVGQKVRVRVDAYPDEAFEGSVERIGHAATSTFALLPAPNPSGNFTKITQRVPVRIAVSQREGRLRPGMMVEVRIATGG
jgi:membrane fusion protein (multidrug efflux system)